MLEDCHTASAARMLKQRGHGGKIGRNGKHCTGAGCLGEHIKGHSRDEMLTWGDAPYPLDIVTALQTVIFHLSQFIVRRDISCAA